MPRTKLNPFRYGHPVPPENFIGREKAIKTIFSRIHNGESTALVGDPHIGKSSLLRYIAHEQVRSQWLEETAGQYGFIEIDGHLIPTSYHPTDFWRQVLDQVEGVFQGENVKVQIQVARQTVFGSFTLKRLFDLLAFEDQCVVLLIDEFDTLLNHANFNTAEFFGALRSLSTLTQGLVLVTASRMSITEMNRRSQQINPMGSPFFNASIEVRLAAFQSAQVDQLFEQVLHKTGIIFLEEEREHIKRLTGRHPYLVQMAGAVLFDMIVAQKDRPIGDEQIHQSLLRAAADHFEHVWRHLTPEAQRAIFIIAAAEVPNAKQLPSGADRLDRYAAELRRLTENGLIERAANKPGTDWQISAASFARWICDNHSWQEVAPPTISMPSNADDRAERLQALRKQATTKRRRLRILEDQAATYGIAVPAEVKMEIEDLEREIEHAEHEIRRLSRSSGRI